MHWQLVSKNSFGLRIFESCPNSTIAWESEEVVEQTWHGSLHEHFPHNSRNHSGNFMDRLCFDSTPIRPQPPICWQHSHSMIFVLRYSNSIRRLTCSQALMLGRRLWGATHEKIGWCFLVSCLSKKSSSSRLFEWPSRLFECPTWYHTRSLK